MILQTESCGVGAFFIPSGTQILQNKKLLLELFDDHLF
jgi:hypothetical protein